MTGQKNIKTRNPCFMSHVKTSHPLKKGYKNIRDLNLHSICIFLLIDTEIFEIIIKTKDKKGDAE